MLVGLAGLAVFYVVWFAILGVIMAEPYLPLTKKIAYGWTVFKDWIWTMGAITAIAILFGILGTGVQYGNS